MHMSHGHILQNHKGNSESVVSIRSLPSEFFSYSDINLRVTDKATDKVTVSVLDWR